MRKKSKIIIGGVLAGVLATTIIISLIPVMLYGVSVDTVTVSWYPYFSPASSTSSMDLDPQDSGEIHAPAVGGTYLTLHAEHVIYNPYAYVATKFQGNVHASSSLTLKNLEALGIHISIKIHLDVTNPLGQSGHFDFNLENLAYSLDVNLVIGTDMMQIVNGTYYFELAGTFSIDIEGIVSWSTGVNANGTIGIIIS